jgi:hypothetical protein
MLPFGVIPFLLRQASSLEARISILTPKFPKKIQPKTPAPRQGQQGKTAAPMARAKRIWRWSVQATDRAVSGVDNCEIRASEQDDNDYKGPIRPTIEGYRGRPVAVCFRDCRIRIGGLYRYRK